MTKMNTIGHKNQYYYSKIIRLMVTLFITCIVNSKVVMSETKQKCDNSKKLKYISGDALSNPDCLSPKGTPYPNIQVSKMFRRSQNYGNSRKGRSYGIADPMTTQRTLLKNYELTNNINPDHSLLSTKGSNTSDRRTKRDYAGGLQDTCLGTPSRLCKTRYNTTAPMYGVSLTSGQPVTIVQKFPDLLQQVVYEVCESGECDVVRGECTQTYVPYLFLVIPLGPVTLTGQDYVLVESGCVCKPKYASNSLSEQSSVSAIPTL